MKKGLTEMVFILDRSGSMHGLETDTIGGFNSMIDEQKKLEGEALVSCVLFNNEMQVIYDRTPLEQVLPMTEKEYSARGTTALIDAIGRAVHHIGNVHKYIREEDVPEHTIFLITTDGMENASHEYSANEVRRMIETRKEQGWEFIFIGANIDSVETAKHFGIREDRTVDYVHDRQGTAANYNAMNKALSSFRQAGAISEAWADEAREDYKKRKGRRRK